MHRSLADVDLATSELPGDELHTLMRQARRDGPVVPARFMGAPAHLITEFAALREFFAAHEQFPGGVVYEFGTRPHIGRTFIDMDGVEHDRYRQLAMPAFRSRAVTRFVDADLTPLADEVLDEMAADGSADLATDLAQVLPFWAISRKLGLPRGSEERQRSWALALLSYPTEPEGALQASAEITEFLRPAMEERRANPGDDVISGLLRGEVHGIRMTDEEVASHIRLLYAVGATTTSDAMSPGLQRLLCEPGLIDRVRVEPEVLPLVVHESLRVEPPVSVLPRIASMGGSIAGVEVPPGAIVLCGIAAANRDPDMFDHPDRFDLERIEREILTFGFGQKYCPGTHLARQQILAAIDAMLEQLPGLRLVHADEPTNAVLRRVEHVQVRWGC